MNNMLEYLSYILFFGMIIMNFIFPFLVLINSDYKRIPWFIVMAGIVILIGHYVDVFNIYFHRFD